jgi:hexosaminidase
MLTRRTYLASAAALSAYAAPDEPAIIPRPLRITPGKGSFTIADNTPILMDAAATVEAKALAASLRCNNFYGAPRDRAIVLLTDPSLSRLGKEGYTLQVTPRRIQIQAPTATGVFYGTMTLKQLLPPEVFSKNGRGNAEWQVPSVYIEDSPRFLWRGGHMDVARNFKPKDAVLRYIDALSIHKINTFHFHLTDDQGWRIENKRYPKLTEIGSVRKETRIGHELRPQGFDGKPHGGFYTQSDIREIVAYAATRHINVVPEIEMPGHAQAALAAYPEFGNTGEKVEVWTQWGVSKNTFSVSEKTFQFLQDVLYDVMDLFPSQYIHVGGDEVPPDQWKASPEAQARMKELKLKNETELHSWFIGRINKFIQSQGRTLVGWDEIIEGGMTQGAVVMSWRGTKGGIEAARHGHDVVMTPGSHTYFDHYQGSDKTEPLAIGGLTTLEKAYGYEPVPEELTPEEAKHILGTQGQLWSEYLPTAEHMEYMAFPRMCALAEVAWTAKDRKDFADFQRRLPVHLERLKAMGVNFRPLNKE